MSRTKQEAQLLQRHCATHYVSKFMQSSFMRYGS